MSCGNFLSSAGASDELVEGAVDLDALKTLLEVFGELLAVFALAAAHHRRQQIEPRALGQRQHAVDHLRDGLAFDRQARGGRVGHADARPQQPHVVVDLGDGADGRARIFRGGLLLDRDRRRQPVDLVDVGLLHHLQELARIGRQRFDVAALALGIDGVEGERGFAGAGQAGEHHQLVARNLEVDVFEIVLARAANCYRAHARSPSRLALRLDHFVHSRHFLARGTRSVRARIAGDAGIGRQWVSSEHRKNGRGFPVLARKPSTVCCVHSVFKRGGNRFASGNASMAAAGSAPQAKRPARGRPFVAKWRKISISRRPRRRTVAQASRNRRHRELVVEAFDVRDTTPAPLIRSPEDPCVPKSM